MIFKFINKKIFGWGYSDAGFVAFFLAILILSAMLGIALSITIVTFYRQRISLNILKSNQAYYVAEAGVEDTLLHLKKGMSFSSPYNLQVSQGTATIEISDPIGGSRTITSQGNISNRIRKLRVIRTMSTQGASFRYGAQAGDGGIEMEPQSKINGNVFSNQTIKLVNYDEPEDTAFVTNSTIVAGSDNKIEKIKIGTAGSNPPDEARVHTCVDSTIYGELYYVSGGSTNCNIEGGSVHILPSNIKPENLPISDSQITNFKNEAAIGGTEGDHTVFGGSTEYLGPKKINGNLIIENNAILILTGNLWLTGNITVNQGATIRLHPSYGSTSGVIVADGKIVAENGAVLEGSGAEGSYVVLLSTNNSIDKDDPAIYVKNNAQGAAFYASDGMIRLRNNISIREATGWKLYLDNNAEITYESGLVNTIFSSGPAGSYEIAEWKEIK